MSENEQTKSDSDLSSNSSWILLNDNTEPKVEISNGTESFNTDNGKLPSDLESLALESTTGSSDDECIYGGSLFDITDRSSVTSVLSISTKCSKDSLESSPESDPKEKGCLTWDEFLEERKIEHDYGHDPNIAEIEEKVLKNGKSRKRKRRKCKAEALSTLTIISAVIAITGVSLACLLTPNRALNVQKDMQNLQKAFTNMKHQNDRISMDTGRSSMTFKNIIKNVTSSLADNPYLKNNYSLFSDPTSTELKRIARNNDITNAVKAINKLNLSLNAAIDPDQEEVTAFPLRHADFLKRRNKNVSLASSSSANRVQCPNSEEVQLEEHGEIESSKFNYRDLEAKSKENEFASKKLRLGKSLKEKKLVTSKREPIRSVDIENLTNHKHTVLSSNVRPEKPQKRGYDTINADVEQSPPQKISFAALYHILQDVVLLNLTSTLRKQIKCQRKQQQKTKPSRKRLRDDKIYRCWNNCTAPIEEQAPIDIKSSEVKVSQETIKRQTSNTLALFKELAFNPSEKPVKPVKCDPAKSGHLCNSTLSEIFQKTRKTEPIMRSFGQDGFKHKRKEKKLLASKTTAARTDYTLLNNDQNDFNKGVRYIQISPRQIQSESPSKDMHALVTKRSEYIRKLRCIHQQSMQQLKNLRRAQLENVETLIKSSLKRFRTYKDACSEKYDVPIPDGSTVTRELEKLKERNRRIYALAEVNRKMFKWPPSSVSNIGPPLNQRTETSSYSVALTNRKRRLDDKVKSDPQPISHIPTYTCSRWLNKDFTNESTDDDYDYEKEKKQSREKRRFKVLNLCTKKSEGNYKVKELIKTYLQNSQNPDLQSVLIKDEEAKRVSSIKIRNTMVSQTALVEPTNEISKTKLCENPDYLVESAESCESCCRNIVPKLKRSHEADIDGLLIPPQNTGGNVELQTRNSLCIAEEIKELKKECQKCEITEKVSSTNELQEDSQSLKSQNTDETRKQCHKYEVIEGRHGLIFKCKYHKDNCDDLYRHVFDKKGEKTRHGDETFWIYQRPNKGNDKTDTSHNPSTVYLMHPSDNNLVE